TANMRITTFSVQTWLVRSGSVPNHAPPRPKLRRSTGSRTMFRVWRQPGVNRPWSGDLRARAHSGCLRYGLGLRTELVRREIIDVDDRHDLTIIVAQEPGLGLRDDAGGESLLDLTRQIEGGHPPGLHAFDTDALLERLD